MTTTATIKTASINCLHVDSSDNRRRFHVIVRVNITGYEDAMARDALTWLLCEKVVGDTRQNRRYELPVGNLTDGSRAPAFNDER